MTTTHKFLGITDTRLECECCGRVDLKSTVVVQITTDHDSRVAYYGSTCAARAFALTAKELKSTVARAEIERQCAAAIESGRATAAIHAYYNALTGPVRESLSHYARRAAEDTKRAAERDLYALRAA